MQLLNDFTNSNITLWNLQKLTEAISMISMKWSYVNIINMCFGLLHSAKQRTSIIMTSKHFPLYRSFVRKVVDSSHKWPVNCFFFNVFLMSTTCWTNRCIASDLRCHDVCVTSLQCLALSLPKPVLIATPNPPHPQRTKQLWIKIPNLPWKCIRKCQQNVQHFTKCYETVN